MQTGEPAAVKIWAYRMESALELVHTNWSRTTHWAYSKGLKGLHSENLVVFHLNKMHIKYHDIRNFCFLRVRANGMTRKDCPKRRPNLPPRPRATHTSTQQTNTQLQNTSQQSTKPA